MMDSRNVAFMVMLAVTAFLLGSADSEREAAAQGYPGGTANSDGNMVAVTGTIGSGVSVLWAIDTRDRRLAVYQCKGGKSIELVAARNIEWDFKIDTLNDVSRRTPGELRKLFLRGAKEGGDGEGASENEGGPGGAGDGPVPGGSEDDG